MKSYYYSKMAAQTCAKRAKCAGIIYDSVASLFNYFFSLVSNLSLEAPFEVWLSSHKDKTRLNSVYLKQLP